MSSTFGGLEIAFSSLQAQQRALDITGQNMANANTPGYVRQSANLVDGPDIAIPGINGQLGTGVNVGSIDRHSDPFLTAQANQQNSQLTEWQTTDNSLQQVEAILNEPSGNGLGSAMDSFWSAWQSLANNPQDDGARAAVVAQGYSLASDFRNVYQNLAGMVGDTNTSISQDVTNFNSLAGQVATLNGQIARSSSQGTPSNSLLDQRDQLLSQMSQLANISVQNNANGSASVFIGGIAAVDGQQTQTLSFTAPALGTTAQVTFSGIGNTPANITSGSIGAKLQLVNNVITDTSGGGSGYLDRLNTLASQVITQVNTLQLSGYDLNNTTNTNAFFTGTSAQDMQVNPALQSNLTLVAASGSTNMPADGSNALNIADLQNTSVAGLGNETMSGYYQGVISTLGVAAQQSNQMVQQNTLLSTTLANQVQGVSGVSIDQESTKMIEYQQAYTAAASFESTVNSMIGSLISAL